MIKCAAILSPDGYIYIGKRHDTIINGFPKGTFHPPRNGISMIQGFITHEYEFVDRKEAGLIAWKCYQIDTPTDCLFSEDLYGLF